MKVGDIVMFTDEGRYKEWFYGKIGTITSAVGGGVSVQWMYPVAYLDIRRATTSNFSADYFTLMRAKK